MWYKYYRTEIEVYSILPGLKEKLTSKELKNIFASKNRELYVQTIIMDVVSPIIIIREFVTCPDEADILLGVKDIMEDAIDGSGMFDTSETVLSIAEIQQNLMQ